VSASRIDRLVSEVRAAELDVLLVSSLVNVRYLTGYSGSNGLALVGPEMAVFLTDFRYVEQAAAEVDPLFERREVPRNLLEGVLPALAPGEVRLGFEAEGLSFARHQKLRELLEDRVELVAAQGLVERLRAVKEPEEAERISAACRLADEALAAVLERGLSGRSERAVALELEWEMRTRGAQRVSFEPIVAAGPHGALPHATPRERAIERGELVVIDWGAELDGYCSDCTRTLAGGPIAQSAREVYELVARAQRAGLDAVRAGAQARAVDWSARELIEAGGQGEHFGHGLGHGVGLEVHEAPTLSRHSEDTLKAGNVVSVEPGIYLPGRLGVRIEDLVLVTESGAKILTSHPKELLELG
jgi:Xaa-Pro aminopeptidase